MAVINKAIAPRVSDVPQPSLWRRLADTRLAYVYILPALVVMAIITAYPLLYEVWMSFTNFGLKNLRIGSPAPDWVWFDNYWKIVTNDLALTNYDFWRLLEFNLFWALSNVVIHVVLGVLIAVLLNIE